MFQTIVTSLAILTLAADALILLSLIALTINTFIPLPMLAPLKKMVQKYGLIVLFAIPAFSVLGSLYFSNYVGFTPCTLCWYQRIFMYPQALLMGTALIYKTRDIVKYLIPLSILGALTSALHYFEQIRAMLTPLDPLIPCSLDGTSCSASYIFEFGFVTIPFMTFTAFVLIIIVAKIAKNKSS